ncbi:MAG: GNAT family N-acetyltransferase, partial [Gaiellaceae bacterium]
VFSLAIRRISDGVAVGAVELRPSSIAGVANVSYLVTAELRGQDLASRSVAAALAWARRELSLRRATISCDAENAASRRLAEKCGFTLCGKGGNELRFIRDLSDT